MPRGIDYVDRMILSELILNSRTSLRSIASKLNLGVSTVYTRIRKLMSLGVLKGFTAEVDLVRLGGAAQAFVEIKPRPQAMGTLVEYLLRHVEVVDLFEVSGEYPLLARVVATDDVGLARAIERIASHEDVVDFRVRYIFPLVNVRASERLVGLLQSLY